jgi:hypothetical protein
MEGAEEQALRVLVAEKEIEEEATRRPTTLLGVNDTTRKNQVNRFVKRLRKNVMQARESRQQRKLQNG